MGRAQYCGGWEGYSQCQTYWVFDSYNGDYIVYSTREDWSVRREFNTETVGGHIQWAEPERDCIQWAGLHHGAVRRGHCQYIGGPQYCKGRTTVNGFAEYIRL